MDLPSLISRTSPFPILGGSTSWVFFFHFFPNFNRTFCKHTVKILIRHWTMQCLAVFDLGLHCLPMSHKKDARLKWVKIKLLLFCLIWFFTSLSRIFQICRDGSSWVEPVLSKDKYVLLWKDTTQWCRWGSNPQPLGLESSTLPLSHCAP